MKKTLFLSAIVAMIFATSCKDQQLTSQVGAQQQSIAKMQEELTRQGEEIKKIKASSSDSIDGVAVKDILAGLQYQVEQLNKQMTKTRKDLYGHLNESEDGKPAEGNITTINGIHFANAQAVITGASQEPINKIAADMQKDAAMKVKIMGHTDNVGSDNYNKQLSLKRALAVKQYLVKKGIAESRITTEGFGATKPVAPNTDEAGKAKNRRVEIMILK